MVLKSFSAVCWILSASFYLFAVTSIDDGLAAGTGTVWGYLRPYGSFTLLLVAAGSAYQFMCNLIELPTGPATKRLWRTVFWRTFAMAVLVVIGPVAAIAVNRQGEGVLCSSVSFGIFVVSAMVPFLLAPRIADAYRGIKDSTEVDTSR